MTTHLTGSSQVQTLVSIDISHGIDGGLRNDGKHGRTRAMLKRKLLIRVAPYFIGCNATIAKLAPTLHVPSMVTPKCATSGALTAAVTSQQSPSSFAHRCKLTPKQPSSID